MYLIQYRTDMILKISLAKIHSHLIKIYKFINSSQQVVHFNLNIMIKNKNKTKLI